MRWTRRALCITVLSTAASWTAPAQAPPAPHPPQPPQPRFVVVLDAAHGGDDSGGKLDGDQLEKAYTLAFSVRLRSLLTARGIQVVTTREQDASVDQNRRAVIANHANAQACISLHASDSGQGVHLYISSLTPDKAVRFAAWKTVQAGWVERSVTLAGTLNSALSHGSIGVLMGRIGMPGIDSMACPAVAIEISPENAGSHEGNGALDDPDYQARVAGALAAALLEWRTEAHQP
jgi:N-acetylmuramoyl-L-alanine amidase